jgi:RecJ-like exonuclease
VNQSSNQSSSDSPACTPTPAANEVKAPMCPGDEAAPGMPGTGEDLCLKCDGTGKLQDGKECPECCGTGKVVRAVGGG